MAACIPSKTVRPMLSQNHIEARRRVLGLYRGFYRSIPYLLERFDIPKSNYQCVQKLRQMFYKHENVTDIRVIDVLVIKGTTLLREMNENWIQKGKVMSLWKPTYEPRPVDFVGKFLQNID